MGVGWSVKWFFRIGGITLCCAAAILGGAVSARAAVLPGRPQSLAATSVGGGEYTLAWNPPQSGEPAQYEIESSTDGEYFHEVEYITGSVESAIFTPADHQCLPACIVRVRAETEAGLGPPSASRFIGATPPSAPRNFEAMIKDGNVVMSWEPPQDDGGFPITGYAVRFSFMGNLGAGGEYSSGGGSFELPPNQNTAMFDAENCVQDGCTYQLSAVSSSGRSAPTQIGYVAGRAYGPPTLTETTTPHYDEEGKVDYELVHITPHPPTDRGGSPDLPDDAFEYRAAAGNPILRFPEIEYPFGAEGVEFACYVPNEDGGCWSAIVALEGTSPEGFGSYPDLGSSFSNVVGCCGSLPTPPAPPASPFTVPSGAQVDLAEPSLPEGAELEAKFGNNWAQSTGMCARPDLHCPQRLVIPTSSGVKAGPITEAEESAPGPVTQLESEVIGTEEVSLHWAPPLDDGGNEVQLYRIERLLDAQDAAGRQPQWDTVDEVIGHTPPTEATEKCPDLLVGKECDFRMVARNAFGESLSVSVQSGARSQVEFHAVFPQGAPLGSLLIISEVSQAASAGTPDVTSGFFTGPRHFNFSLSGDDTLQVSGISCEGAGSWSPAGPAELYTGLDTALEKGQVLSCAVTLTSISSHVNLHVVFPTDARADSSLGISGVDQAATPTNPDVESPAFTGRMHFDFAPAGSAPLVVSGVSCGGEASWSANQVNGHYASLDVNLPDNTTLDCTVTTAVETACGVSGCSLRIVLPSQAGAILLPGGARCPPTCEEHFRQGSRVLIQPTAVFFQDSDGLKEELRRWVPIYGDTCVDDPNPGDAYDLGNGAPAVSGQCLITLNENSVIEGRFLPALAYQDKAGVAQAGADDAKESALGCSAGVLFLGGGDLAGVFAGADVVEAGDVFEAAGITPTGATLQALGISSFTDLISLSRAKSMLELYTKLIKVSFGACAWGFAGAVANGVKSAVDPPDNGYLAIALPTAPSTGPSPCKRMGKAGQWAKKMCGWLYASAKRYRIWARRVASLEEAGAVAGNRYSTAVREESAAGAATQRAVIAALDGELAQALAKRAGSGRVLAKALGSKHIEFSLTTKGTKNSSRVLRKLKGVPKSVLRSLLKAHVVANKMEARQAVAMALSKAGHHPLSQRKALQQAPPTSVLLTNYRSLQIADVHAIATALEGQAMIPQSQAAAIQEDLTKAESSCTSAGRNDAFNDLLNHAKNKKLSAAYAGFLKDATDGVGEPLPPC